LDLIGTTLIYDEAIGKYERERMAYVPMR
jgi:hypothetical protein